MDKQTRDYRKDELDVIKFNPPYCIRVKFFSESGDTKHLSITEEEFRKVKDILTGKNQRIIDVFKFSELSKEVQENVIEKNYDINGDYNWCDYTYDDAKNIGLEITEFDLYRREIDGILIDSAENVIEKILSEHGKECETYKTAERYKKEFSLLKGDEEEIEEQREEITECFRRAILQDYLYILDREYDDLTSEKAIIETIEINEYEFDKEGNRV